MLCRYSTHCLRIVLPPCWDIAGSTAFIGAKEGKMTKNGSGFLRKEVLETLRLPFLL